MSVFHMRAVEKDVSGYCYVNWDNSFPVEVEAETRDEAFATLWKILGDAPRGRGWTWTAKIKKVTASCSCKAEVKS